MNYEDDDKIVQNLRRSYPGQWSEGARGEQVWDDYKQAFTRMPANHRAAVLDITNDVFLGAIHVRH